MSYPNSNLFAPLTKIQQKYFPPSSGETGNLRKVSLLNVQLHPIQLNQKKLHLLVKTNVPGVRNKEDFLLDIHIQIVILLKLGK